MRTQAPFAPASQENVARGGQEPVRIKCCGMFREQDIAAVNAAQPDLCGFIVDFPKSHRSVTPERLEGLASLVRPGITRVGVFVDENPQVVADLLGRGVIDAVQLHGHESDAYVHDLVVRIGGDSAQAPKSIIQAFRVRTPADIERANASAASIVLLDNGQGTGQAFDWSLLAGIERPFILAGGLGPSNVEQAIREVKAQPCGPYLWGVDMSSGLETNRVKDPKKIKAAVAAVRRANDGK